MESVEELLLNSLKELGKDDLKAFQWHLKKNHKEISTSEMEDADRLTTVDIMVDFFGEEEAVKNMVKILKKMNKNNQAKLLEDNHKKASSGGSTDNPQLAGNSSNPIGPTDISTARPPHGTSSNVPSNFTNIAPSNRDDLLKYFLRLTLDPNTAYKHLHLSDNNREVSYTPAQSQPYPDHPNRFDYYYQVLCRECVSGCCYWEIEWSGVVYISVSYISIGRKGWGDECAFGQNDKSWCLFCSPTSYSILHNDIKTDISVKPISSKIGVYVDYNAGALSFYSVSTNTVSLIHTVQTTFTQPLYPGFYLDYKSSVKLC